MIKRLFDIVFALVGLTLFAPLMLYAAYRVKKEDGGPIFYKGLRVGLNGKPFHIIKYRTMVLNADKIGGPSTSRDDPRITKAGRWIRKFNLDELSQFINVLIGNMSIVGPRPEVPQYVALFNAQEKKILTVKPGITDWATLWVRDEGKLLEGAADPEKAYMEKVWPEKHRLQLKYVENYSLWQDFKIMMLTFKTHLIDRMMGVERAAE